MQHQIPVTILGLDLDEDLQDVRIKPAFMPGPAGQVLKKGHSRTHSDPYAQDYEYDDIYLRGKEKRSIECILVEVSAMKPTCSIDCSFDTSQWAIYIKKLIGYSTLITIFCDYKMFIFMLWTYREVSIQNVHGF